MNNTRKVAERVRPFLRAMEESIDAARQQRLHGGTEPAPVPERPAPPQPADVPAATDEPAPRLRARPKRPSSFVSSCEESRAQTRAG